MSDEEAVRIVDKSVSDLREFFPDVQVLVSWPDDDRNGNTFDCFRGNGNWYARAGMAREFLMRDESKTTAHEVSKKLNEREDEQE